MSDTQLPPILVAGLVNLETTVPVDSFPVPYAPVVYHFGEVRATVSGVGYNITRALQVLGNDVRLLGLVSDDILGKIVQARLVADEINTAYLLPRLAQTPHSVILFDSEGRRRIHTDLEDIQERHYPPELFGEAAAGCDLLVLTNINFTRPFLSTPGYRIATDVHAISDLDDVYNRDYMAAADILFMSDERLPCAPEQWVRRVQNRYGPEIVVVGMGAAGALLGVRSDNFLERIPAAQAPQVSSTVGAGDALFSSFLHSYRRDHDPYTAIGKAVVFAAHKVASRGGAEGFLDAASLERRYAELS